MVVLSPHLERDNSKDDELSKEDLEFHRGTYAYYEYKEGVEVEATKFCF